MQKNSVTSKEILSYFSEIAFLSWYFFQPHTLFSQCVFAGLYSVNKALASYLFGFLVKVNFHAEIENADAYDDEVAY